MENKENKVEESKLIIDETKPKRNWKKFAKYFSISLGALLVIGVLLRIYIVSLPISGNGLYCEYKGKFNKIVCIQTGDVVPKWLDLSDNVVNGLFGGKIDYSMLLIFKKADGRYATMKMVDKTFVTNLPRKFIYEKHEQTLNDYALFKDYVYNGEMSNWGSVVLYCSDTNLTDKICKDMKKQYK